MTEPLILGVSRTHDVGAALIRGSDLLVLAEAERVLDDKHAQGRRSCRRRSWPR